MLKQQIFELVQKGDHGQKNNRYFDFAIMTLIILSVISIILESFESIYSSYGSILNTFNTFSVIVFTIEYLMRLYVSDLTHPSESRLKSAFKFMFSVYGLIDLLAILPFYIPMVVRMDLRYLRALRLVRILRILKVNRYNNSLTLIWEVLKEKKSELAVTGFLSLVLLLLCGFALFEVEHDAQPELFPNVLAAFWWAIATVVKVGHNGGNPVTEAGTLINGLIALIGIALIAIPTGIISSGFIGKMDNKRKKEIVCPNCGELINK